VFVASEAGGYSAAGSNSEYLDEPTIVDFEVAGLIKPF